MAVSWGLVCGPLALLILTTLHSAWVAMLAYHTGCVSLAVRIAALGERPRAAWLALVGAGTMVAVAIAGAALVAWVSDSYLQMTRWREWGVAAPGDTALLAYYVLVNPWIEECFWRGGLCGPVVRRQLGTISSPLVSIACFWVFHLFVLCAAFGRLVGTWASVFVLLAAVAWTLARLRTKSVWWSAVSHQGANLALAMVYFTRLRGLG
jgi:membrane protease YdiL (CAAX protease family)